MKMNLLAIGKIHKVHGFTLIEVLVALAIVALCLAALAKLISSGSFIDSKLREKTLAHEVATAIAGELDHLLQEPQRLQPGTFLDHGQVQQFNSQWQWHMTLATTEIPKVKQAKIHVAQVENPTINATVEYYYASN